MIKYDTLANVSGVYPDAKPQDVSAPSAGDGTKVEAAWVTQTWGFFQAITDTVSWTPNTADEVHDASQLMDSLIAHLAPVGQMVGWQGAADPDTLSNPTVRLLPLEGQVVLIANYPDLAARCYIGDGNNSDTGYPYWYKSTDSGGVTRSTAGTYIKVADCRGAFLRGKDPTATRDPDGTTRKFPDVQGYALQTHEHEIQSNTGSKYTYGLGLQNGTGSSHSYLIETAVQVADRFVAGTITSATTDANESRPVNVQTLWCIRY